MSLRDRVAVGVRFLDETLPDWRTFIGVGYLNMSSTSTCTLGQLFGWQRGIETLFAWWETQDQSGWLGPVDEPMLVYAGFEKDEESYEELRNEWLRVIANEPECDGCDQDPWRKPVHYGTCPLNTTSPVSEPSDTPILIGRNA